MAGSPSIDEARAAKNKALQLLQDRRIEAGVGIARVAGGYGLKVNLQASPDDEHLLPAEIDGVPIHFEIVGTIKKR